MDYNPTASGLYIPLKHWYPPVKTPEDLHTLGPQQNADSDHMVVVEDTCEVYCRDKERRRWSGPIKVFEQS